jgi:hypothetical protein
VTDFPCYRPLPENYGYALRTRRGFVRVFGDAGYQDDEPMWRPSASGPGMLLFRNRDGADGFVDADSFLVAVWSVSGHFNDGAAWTPAEDRRVWRTTPQCWEVERRWQP